MQRILSKYVEDFEEFGQLRFEIRPVKYSRGTNEEKIYLLNEEQAALLMTYLRNNEIVRKFKKNLVHQFYAMRRFLIEKQSKLWNDTRLGFGWTTVAKSGNKDYTSEQICTLSGGTPKKEHIIKLDTAKEMAMLEKNNVGKGVRKYFIQIEKKYKKITKKSNIEQGIAVVKFIADDLRVSESSRLFMYENYCRDVGMPTSFLPKYSDNGSREQCSATTLLERNGCGIKTAKFSLIITLIHS